ncbi:hypothetical protein PTI98_010612 [Pleurotus ostreatus]|nr:hypothetical protein PTI98_010612 [Pleurotus ostreatus]
MHDPLHNMGAIDKCPSTPEQLVAASLRRRNLSLDVGLYRMPDSAVFHEAAHPVNIIKLVKRNLFQWVFLSKCYSFACAT